MEQHYIFHIKKGFARTKRIPSIFIGVIINDTEKSALLKGRITKSLNRLTHRCFFCAKKLDRGSLEYHVGACEKCGDRIGGWDRIGGYKKLNLLRLTKFLSAFVVSQWVPKSCILKQEKVDLQVFRGEEIQQQNGDNAIRVTKKEAFIKNGYIHLSFPTDTPTLNFVKSLPGSCFGKNDIFWKCVVSRTNLRQIKEMGFDLCKKCRLVLRNKKQHTNDKVDVDKLVPVVPSKILRKPYHFQQIGIAFLRAKRGRGLIADEMGLGKTMQALGYILSNPSKRPVVIICPAAVKFTWVNEIQKTIPNASVHALLGRTTHQIDADIIVVNYSILDAWVDMLRHIKPQIIVTDECHYYKNVDAKRTKAVFDLCEGVKRVIALSGTPIENSPQEFWTVLHLLNPNIFHNYYSFIQKYCDAKRTKTGYIFGKNPDTKALYNVLNGVVMIRRLKKDVLKDLPDKVFTVIPLQIDNMGEYKTAKANFVKYLNGQLDKRINEVNMKSEKELISYMKANRIALQPSSRKGFSKKDRERIAHKKTQKTIRAQDYTQIEVLKQIAVKGKMQQVTAWIDDFLQSGKKLVVFAEHLFVLDILTGLYKGVSVRIDGGVSSKKRAALVERFQTDDKIKLFLGNKAAEVGLTLTAASDVCVIEFPWTPGKLAQRVDRCHRLTQKNTVNVYYLIAKDTIETRICAILDRKAQLISSALDGENGNPEYLIYKLLEELKNGQL